MFRMDGDMLIEAAWHRHLEDQEDAQDVLARYMSSSYYKAFLIKLSVWYLWKRWGLCYEDMVVSSD